MEFNLQKAIEIISRTPAVVETMLYNLSEEWIMNNEGDETWSPFDIVGHYIHGEKTDWIPRMEIILSDNDDKTFVPFDRFAQFNDSKGKTLAGLIDEFKQLRKENLKKLTSANLTEADLDKTGVHPHFGAVTLRQLLASWVVHDLAHINQLTRVMAKQYSDAVGPWKEYMGILNRENG
jgi:hypothetical protein